MTARANEPTISIRLLWPFARVAGADAQLISVLTNLGLNATSYADPDFRVPHRVGMEALIRAIAVTDDPTLGLRAGHGMDQGDFAAVEYAAGSAENLSEALEMLTRHMRVFNEFIQAKVTVEGKIARFSIRPKDGSTMHPAANDFTVAASLSFSRRNLANYAPPLEIALMHERPSYAEEYATYFEAPVRFGAPTNAVTFPAEALQWPMRRAHAGVAAAFDQQVRRVLKRLEASDGITGKVREGIPEDLKHGSPSMGRTARRLGMAVATLRRRLEEEGTTFSDIVDRVRKEMATRHLSETTLTVSEIAFLLGFSDVRAFGRAFRRWTGQSPTEYRTERGG